MIYDEIVNIKKYRGISKNLDTAIKFITNMDLNNLPLGQTEIDGERVYINVMMADGAVREALNYEVHRNYLDIQMDIVGTEWIDMGYGQITLITAYDEERDISFHDAQFHVPCRLGMGMFIICMNGEPHKPGVKMPGYELKKKCVIKVLQE